MTGSPEFYVGYRREAPSSLASFVRTIVLALLVAAIGLAALMAALQGRFDPGVFEYGQVKRFEGVVLEGPHPVLLVDPTQTVGDSTVTRFLLVGEGKHGAEGEVDGLAGFRVALQGTLIHRDGEAMIEVEDGSVELLSESVPQAPSRDISLGTHTLAGEIVDSKCFFGVMKPGRRKPHRACATRCISGGIPPVLRVETSAGEFLHLLLIDPDGGRVNERVLEFVAEPIEITGTVLRRGDQLLLAADPADYLRR